MGRVEIKTGNCLGKGVWLRPDRRPRARQRHRFGSGQTAERGKQKDCD
jgi:hypothetical protein